MIEVVDISGIDLMNVGVDIGNHEGKVGAIGLDVVDGWIDLLLSATAVRHGHHLFRLLLVAIAVLWAVR